jgi:hypothetical protein
VSVSVLRSNSASTVTDLEVELGIWLAAIESFVGTAGHPFADRMNSRAHDWTGDLNVTISGLILCSALIARSTTVALTSKPGGLLSIDELDSLSDVVIDALNVGNALSRSKPISFSEWRSWCRLTAENLHSSPGFEKVVGLAVKAGEAGMPPRLKKLVQNESLAFADRFDLAVIVPGFARILRWLSVVEQMLLSDAPLKPALLIFARVYEDTLDLVGHINRRLQRFADEDAELFRALDSASYIASIELRKVCDQELAGLVSVRSAVTVYARTETAFASLRDNIHQILAGIAKLVDPKIEPHEIFPIFGEKLDASLKLRDELARMSMLVREAEADVVSNAISEDTLRAFLAGPVPSLFYKDRESVERFVEEILRTGDRKDLVPILHRFGAYLETLFSHVNNRTVLRDHPFQQ